MDENLEKFLQADSWFGHPVHPALVAFPIGMWCLGTTMDFISIFTKNKCIQEAADHSVTAGLVGAGMAAATGLGEFMRVPKDEHAQSTALTHATVNVSAVAVNSINAIIRNGRRATGRPGGALPKFLSLVGISLISYSSWLGGSLVYRHGTAVNVEHEAGGKPESERKPEKQQEARMREEEARAHA
jgi:uncharacterized membrane protein